MSESAVEVHGECASGLDAVREAFARVFPDQGEVGAAIAVTVDNRPLIDLWAGHMDAERTRPWERDTIVNLYSVGKGISALCANMLVDRGLLDLDAPVARYWPQFAQAGKSELPVRYLLTHEAGLPGVEGPLPPKAILDWDLMCDALAKQTPWWAPGTQHGYHTNTLGFLVGELVRRIDGRSLGTFFREEVSAPADIDFHIGFGPELDGRVAEDIRMVPRDGEEQRPAEPSGDEPPSMRELVARYPELRDIDLNGREWRAAEVPSTNGHGNARALARLYGALACGGAVDGVRLLSPQAIERATVEQVYGEDAILGRVTRFGLGFQITMPERPLGPNPRTFGHFGAGGSLGFADPDARLGFGYAMNRGRSGWQHRHVRHLIDLVYAEL